MHDDVAHKLPQLFIQVYFQVQYLFPTSFRQLGLYTSK